MRFRRLLKFVNSFHARDALSPAGTWSGASAFNSLDSSQVSAPNGAAARSGLRRTWLVYKMRTLGISHPSDDSRTFVEIPPSNSRLSADQRLSVRASAVKLVD